MGMYFPPGNEQVKITFESNAQIIDFEEPTKTVTRQKGPLPARSHGRPTNHEEQKIADHESSEIEQLEKLEKMARSYVNKHVNDNEREGRNVTRKLRHARKHSRHRKIHEKHHHKPEKEKAANTSANLTVKRKTRKLFSFGSDSDDNSARKSRLKSLSEELNSIGEDRAQESQEIDVETPSHGRHKRNQEAVKLPDLLDQGIQHGGNALRNSSESSVSSFEEGLLDCYDGQILGKREFPPSKLCTDVNYLANGTHMQTHHDVIEDGYYYYIFYSDNDIVFNDIHAVFDIYKPTFQYENVTNSCLNKTECTFPFALFSNDRVIVEVPTRDGIDHEEDDSSLLVSVCQPRMAIYTIFPIALLFLIISCAFM